MKKILVYSICAVLTLSGCYSNTGQGAYAGASLGSIIGSAIGGISGGPRGSDVGTLIGMAGGAIVGAAVGNASDKAANNEYQRHKAAIYGDGQTPDDTYNRSSSRHSAYVPGGNSDADESGFDPNNGGDDRIEFDATPSAGANATDQTFHVGNAPKSTVPVQEVSLHDLSDLKPTYNIKYNALIEVRNATFIDDTGDGVLRGGEQGKVTFEIMNNSHEVLRDVVPTVIETTGNKRIHISPSIRVESIAPGQGVRYTATVVADKRLKEGAISIKIAVAQNGNEITSQVKEFEVKTQKKI